MGRFCIATMDTRSGWETESPLNAISLHTTYFFAARENQDKLLGGVPNFYGLWQKYGETPERMVSNLKSIFTDYMKEQFDEVLIEVIKQNITGQANNYRLILTGKIVVDGAVYDLAETILVTGEFYKVLTNERLKQ